MKLSKAIQFIRNMGLRYVIYRVGHEVEKRIGVLRRRFPMNPEHREFTSLAHWKESAPPFFIGPRESLNIPKKRSLKLQEEALKIVNGNIKFFHSEWKNLGNDYDWITNPDSGYTYDLTHWSEISSFSTRTGDIKYVWEKSRFVHVQTIIRYDYHFEEDHAEWVFAEIDSWIRNNPVNTGPNWVCSQETSIRLLNWCYALYFYKNSPSLTQERWVEYTNTIYWKLHHIYHHINFSRIAVRNNHAITETLALYIGGLLFPHLGDARKWSGRGKKWLEEEITYQIYEDGTYLQFSHNYHRVAIQLLTLALRFCELHNDKFQQRVYDRANRSLDFLYQQMMLENGELPRYGNNDGALFFNFSDTPYHDYRSQLNALYYCLHKQHLLSEYQQLEDVYWYYSDVESQAVSLAQREICEYPKGGFYNIRDEHSMTAIRCGLHTNRPAQADNLHLDIWVNGVNIIRDAGTYKYNTEKRYTEFFFGTRSHNTVMLGDNDQMLKGSRFIWYHWSQAEYSEIEEHEHYFQFKGRIRAFQYLDKKIAHTRTVRKYKNQLKWEITDYLDHHTGLPIHQIWNPHPDYIHKIDISAKDNNGALSIQEHDGWYSDHYGHKENTKQFVFSTSQKTITTEITIDL